MIPNDYDLLKKPEVEDIYMIAGWRQWADGGSVSSGLPKYLVRQARAKKIGQLHPDGFYIFQIPGTHDLMRPVVKFLEGYPDYLETQHNDFYYAGDEHRGVVIFLGDEPHLDAERYVQNLLNVAEELGVKRIIGLGGVYGEVPYDKERLITSNYSMLKLKDELENLSVSLSDYRGGASIGSYLCRRAGERGMEYVGLYAFVPFYDFSGGSQDENLIRVDNDYLAWLAVMRRINYMIKTGYELTDLEKKSRRMVKNLGTKIDELDKANPELGVREFFINLNEGFKEVPFSPLDEVWEKNIGHLLNNFDAEAEPGEIPDE